MIDSLELSKGGVVEVMASQTSETHVFWDVKRLFQFIITSAALRSLFMINIEFVQRPSLGEMRWIFLDKKYFVENSNLGAKPDRWRLDSLKKFKCINKQIKHRIYIIFAQLLQFNVAKTSRYRQWKRKFITILSLMTLQRKKMNCSTSSLIIWL